MTHPLMPKATAIWLIENTALTFDQIADFCGLHALEVKGIADDDVAHGIKGLDPISNGQLTRDELERCQSNPEARLEISTAKRELPEPKQQKGAKYTPLSKRQERPDAIYWLVRNHPELNDAQIGRLVGTTKPTIQTIRERTHWNISNLKPLDPVTLGLCKQVELDHEVARAAKRVARAEKRQARQQAKQTEEKLMSVEESLQPTPAPTPPAMDMDTPSDSGTQADVNDVFTDSPTPAPQEEETEKAPDVDSVFGNFNKADD